MLQNKIKLGVFGFGCVGQGLYQTLQKTKGLKAEIVKICVKDRSKSRSLDPETFTFDRNDILDNDDINVVVELIDDPVAAFEIVSIALKKRKAVVTANKKMIADHFEELVELQNKYKVPLLYEASCCASIPVIRNLEEYYDNDLINSLEGILNGSTNYILTKIFNENLSYQKALKEAQDKGFAESDPSLDVEGYDPKNKLCIIIAHTFGLFLKPEQIFNLGINRINDFDINFARQKGLKIKLIAFTRKLNSTVVAGVLPALVESSHPLYQIENEFNGVSVEGAFSEKQLFIGKGAGSYPTGAAVLSDLSALTYSYKYEYKKLYQDLKLTYSDDFYIDIYLRFPTHLDIKTDVLESIYELYKTPENTYVCGTVNFGKLSQAEWINDPNVNVMLLPNSQINLKVKLKKGI